MNRFIFIFALMQISLSVLAGELRKETNEYYKGIIGPNIEFKMVISNEWNRCGGSYFYLKRKKAIYLSGICTADKFDLKEEINDSVLRERGIANRFIGTQNGDKITGIWRSYDGKREYAFTATKIAPDRREVMEDAKGEYPLASIQGWYGANQMSDIDKNQHGWQASSSSIFQGMRQGNNPTLTKYDRLLLSSFKLVVDESLRLRIYAKGRIAADFPFTNQPTFTVKRITKAEDSMEQIYIYENVNSFIENKMHIAMTDDFSFAKYLPFESTPIDTVHAISVDYSPYGHAFEVQVIDKQCCGRTILSFTKR